MSDPTIKTFRNYFFKKDLEQAILNCQIDTTTKSKDSVLIVFHRQDNSLFKTIKEYYYYGYLIKEHGQQDSFKLETLRDDTTVIIQITTTYYDSLGNVVFNQDKDFDRASIADSPDYGSITIIVTDNPRVLYRREQYNSLNQLTTEIFYSQKDGEYKRVRYCYNAKDKNVNKQEELISIKQFWNN